MGKIDNAVNWCVEIANDNTHGYSQDNRWGPDYDCSSLLITAWQNAGVKVKTAGARNTRNMINAFISCGFKDVTASVDFSTGAGLKKGDVVWRSGHVEMMISSSKIVGAHQSETGSTTGVTGDQTGSEISINNYYNGNWTKALRFTGDTPDTSEGISKNDYLTQSEMETNAKIIYAFFSSLGFTLNAVAGMLGNMQRESSINPGIWQNKNEGNVNGGLGLVQWTPATRLINWCTEKGYDYLSLDGQLARLKWEYEDKNSDTYYSTDAYPESYEEFAHSTKTPEYLAMAFLKNYERAGESAEEERQQNARNWYNFLLDYDPSYTPDVDPTPSPSQKKKSLSLLLMYIATRKKV